MNSQATLFADMAAPEREQLQAKNEVRYLPLACRTILNPCNTCRMPNAVTMNPYRGCEFGCAYCYARYTHEFMELPWDEFEKRIFVKTQAADVLLRTLDVEKLRGKHLAIGSATDPYQPAESRYLITRRLLEVFAQVGGLTISLTTKSALVKRDLDLFKKISERNDFRINISLISLNRDLLRALEPKASAPDARLAALKRISDAGVRAGVLLMPIIPGLTDAPRTLEAVVRAAAANGALYVHARVLFLRESARRAFYAFLQQSDPQLLRRYRSIYGKRTYTAEEYQKRLLCQVKELRERYGLRQRESEFESPEALVQTGYLFDNPGECAPPRAERAGAAAGNRRNCEIRDDDS
jgi:DNA repair photolyase